MFTLEIIECLNIKCAMCHPTKVNCHIHIYIFALKAIICNADLV